ncbi:hypothetical protein PS893_04836 [Pseudomonas fluorescens]|jgi:hypothetical protein|nr:hypothetical protein PS893_04836 [Pseudomonas fluorescens]
MDNLTLRYFDAEMRYLREAGQEFAQAFPDRAAQLNLDKPGARDPYVERLFEGFAFLMGRLREKLDDDLPELTEGLVSLLWPHYLRTIPSLSIVELGRAAADVQHLARGQGGAAAGAAEVGLVVEVAFVAQARVEESVSFLPVARTGPAGSPATGKHEPPGG